MLLSSQCSIIKLMRIMKLLLGLVWNIFGAKTLNICIAKITTRYIYLLFYPHPNSTSYALCNARQLHKLTLFQSILFTLFTPIFV